MMILNGSLQLSQAGLLCDEVVPGMICPENGKNDWLRVCFSSMANTMSYFDLVGDDCMERIMETSADQLKESIDRAVKKLRHYARVRYKEESEVSKGAFSMNRLKLAVARQVLKTA